MIPFAKALSALREAREEARNAIRIADACAAAARVGTPAKARERLEDLVNALVHVKEHCSIAESDKRNLERGAPSYRVDSPALLAEQCGLQREFVEEIRAALARLEKIGGQMRSEEDEERRRAAIADAGEAFARGHAAADRVDAAVEELRKRGL